MDIHEHLSHSHSSIDTRNEHLQLEVFDIGWSSAAVLWLLIAIVSVLGTCLRLLEFVGLVLLQNGESHAGLVGGRLHQCVREGVVQSNACFLRYLDRV